MELAWSYHGASPDLVHFRAAFADLRIAEVGQSLVASC